MEVHQHSHSERKKWKHYFWEFLMLFLAVFCGFLAENIREHMIEKDRSHQYIHSLYEDLQSDTAKLSLIIDYDYNKIKTLDNMSSCFETLMENKNATPCMREILKYSMISRGFTSNGRTLKQLENAGGFRLLNKDDADSIIKYESQFTAYHNFETTILQSSQDNIRNTFNSIADYRTNSHLLLLSNDIITADSTNDKINLPILFTTDKASINKYFNELLQYKRVNNLQRIRLGELKNRATNIITYLKNKYHFE